VEVTTQENMKSKIALSSTLCLYLHHFQRIWNRKLPYLQHFVSTFITSIIACCIFIYFISKVNAIN